MDNQLLRFVRFACTSMAVARGWVPFRSTKYAPTYQPLACSRRYFCGNDDGRFYRGLEDLLGLSRRLRRLFGLLARTGSFEPVMVRPPPPVAGTD
jgi:hypothetical protein